MQRNRDIQVSIIGGGLVGSLCACLLGNRNVRIKLHEFRADPRQVEFNPDRSINLALSKRGLSALRLAGLEEEVIERHGIPMVGRMLHAVDGKKTPLPYDSIDGNCTYSVERRYLIKLLLSAAERKPKVQIHFKSKFLDCDLKSGKYSVLGADGVVKEETCDLLIGCDGARSAVRHQMLNTPRFNYSQTYAEVGYLALRVPSTDTREFAMERNYLHVWPRQNFMMVAFPNQDCTFTITLTLPFPMFDSIKTPQHLLKFFSDNFADVLPLIGREKLIADYFKTTPSTLVNIKCGPHHFEDKVLLLGDSSHATVPFYGQGMNAGMEDCELLVDLIDEYSYDLKKVLPAYTKRRQRDAEAICDLSLSNFQELSTILSAKKVFLRKVDHLLYTLFPQTCVPIHILVIFSQMRYSHCILRKEMQDKIRATFLWFIIAIVIAFTARIFV